MTFIRNASETINPHFLCRCWFVDISLIAKYFQGEAVTFRATSQGILASLNHCFDIIVQKEEYFKKKMESEVERRRQSEDLCKWVCHFIVSVLMIFCWDFTLNYISFSLSSRQKTERRAEQSEEPIIFRTRFWGKCTNGSYEPRFQNHVKPIFLTNWDDAVNEGHVIAD